ncbi:ROK family protein [Bacillus shivajii]|uniref:ROK family protein n=1 Tax=Bacillus shivajii TaxID=1983719 RepID=UPI001CFA4140|nr:ROK family protein [Bacillus shivajii]UCZ53635.1 ROK family protein [Bacillus shivajii]
MTNYTVGIDIGGTSVRAALVSRDGKMITHKMIPTESEKGPEALVEKLKGMVHEVTIGKSYEAIGVGCPGPLNPFDGVILDPPNLKGWRNVPLREMLEQAFNKNVTVDNDANAAALGEAIIGAGKGYGTVFYITVSTGIGGGIVINERIFHGAQGNAGEIGNMVIESDRKKVGNLNGGALETLASGTAIGMLAHEKYEISGGAKAVFEKMESGDRDAYEIIDQAMTHLAIGIGNIANSFNPSVFVLGGGVMEQSAALAMVNDKAKNYLYESLKEDLIIKKAELGKDAGVIGAAMLPNYK